MKDIFSEPLVGSVYNVNGLYEVGSRPTIITFTSIMEYIYTKHAHYYATFATAPGNRIFDQYRTHLFSN